MKSTAIVPDQKHCTAKHCQPLRSDTLSPQWTASLGRSGWWSSSLGPRPELCGYAARTCEGNLTWSGQKRGLKIAGKCRHAETRGRCSPPPTHLSSSVEFIGEFDFAERDGGFHPVRTEVWGIRVDVHAAGRLGFGFSSRSPLPVHVLPPVVVRRHEVQQNGIHGVRVQAGHVYFEHRKHAPIGGK